MSPEEADISNQKILAGWSAPTWDENPITAKRNAKMQAELEYHKNSAEELYKALNDLSFECFGAICTVAPSIKTYNDTFIVLHKFDNYLAKD